jgi:hypothetical protein
MPRGLLDVMGAEGGGCSALGQCLRRALVRDEAHARGTALVHGGPHKRVAELEAARYLAGTDEVSSDQLVEGGQGIRLRHRGGRHREVELERVSRHGGRLDQGPHLSRKPLQLAGDRGADRRGDAVGARRPVALQAVRARPSASSELQQIEGIASALPVQAI